MTYHIYLRDTDQIITDKTVTSDQVAAAKAFADLVDRTELDGRPLLAVINRDGRIVAQHDFRLDKDGAAHSPANHWRGRIDKLRIDAGSVRLAA